MSSDALAKHLAQQPRRARGCLAREWGLAEARPSQRRPSLCGHLPEHYQRLQYFVGGPGSMMDATQHALAEIGVPAVRTRTRLRVGLQRQSIILICL